MLPPIEGPGSVEPQPSHPSPMKRPEPDPLLLTALGRVTFFAANLEYMLSLQLGWHERRGENAAKLISELRKASQHPRLVDRKAELEVLARDLAELFRARNDVVHGNWAVGVHDDAGWRGARPEPLHRAGKDGPDLVVLHASPESLRELADELDEAASRVLRILAFKPASE